MDATWHSGPCDSATRAHAVPTWRDIYLLIYIVYNIICSAFRISEGNINPLESSLLLNSTDFFKFSRVGQSPT